MGRSKFPGKPTKLVNKKRISVLSSGSSNNSDSNLFINDDDFIDNNENIVANLWNNNGLNAAATSSTNHHQAAQSPSQSSSTTKTTTTLLHINNNDGDDNNIQKPIVTPSSEQPPPPLKPPDNQNTDKTGDNKLVDEPEDEEDEPDEFEDNDSNSVVSSISNDSKRTTSSNMSSSNGSSITNNTTSSNSNSSNSTTTSGNSNSTTTNSNSSSGVKTRARSSNTTSTGTTTVAQSTSTTSSTTTTTNSTTTTSSTTNSSSNNSHNNNSSSNNTSNNSTNKDKETTTKEDSKKSKKKTVTFKNILETSDDVRIKKVYNPDGVTSLVPIIKRESLNRTQRLLKSECLVRPSRLTEILRNSQNNIDKLNSITFRSSNSAASLLSSSMLTQSLAASISATTTITTTLAAAAQTHHPQQQHHHHHHHHHVDKISMGGDKKFILPKRSLHSCRVIKPNKRFLDGMDDIFNKRNVRRLNKTLTNDSVNEGGEQENNNIVGQQNNYDEDEDEEDDDDEDESESSKSMTDEDESDDSLSTSIDRLNEHNKSSLASALNSTQLSLLSSSLAAASAVAVTSPVTTATSITAGKFILRQPKLQFPPSSNNPINDRPFSTFNISNSMASNNLLGSLTSAMSNTTLSACRICGTTSSSFGLDLNKRKYGIVSCEACRKFISKMVKKLACNNNNSNLSNNNHIDASCDAAGLIKTENENGTNNGISTNSGKLMLDCSKNDGTCIIMPLIKNLNLRLLRKIFKERCHACWLKKCLKLYQLPPGYKTRLLSILPENMRDFKPAANNLFLPQTQMANSTANKIMNPLIENNVIFGSTPVIKPKIEDLFLKSEQITSDIVATSVSTATTTTAVMSTNTTPVTLTSSATTVTTTPTSKRQRIDLKGPRVKHVCRSASIVLGQPIATFESQATGSPISDTVEIAAVNLTEEPQIAMELEEVPEPTLIPTSSTTDILLENSNSSTSLDISILELNKSKILTRKLTRPGLLSSSASVMAAKRQQSAMQQQRHQISIDFWENYDPAEINRNGFGIILTEALPIPALCFLCGSLGKDKLIFCVCCCEPYHKYCIEDEYNLNFNEIITLNNNNHLNWLCPRCTVCYNCNMSSGSKIKCNKCNRNYHLTCLNTNKKLLISSDRSLICSNCLKCTNCNTTNVTKFIGNLPTCNDCYKMKQLNNFCPMCNKHDNGDKIMECGHCRKWIHIRCEGITDEQYNILSGLSESIKFICKKCIRMDASLTSNNTWYDAVLNEFRTGLLTIIKMLSKSQHGTILLKISPRKKIVNCTCQPIVLANRSIQFSGAEITSSQDSNEFNKCYCRNNNNNNIQNLIDIKKKINSLEYYSIYDFNYDMQIIINALECEDLMITYKEVLSEIFPWFQNETKACTDALVEDMYDSISSSYDDRADLNCLLTDNDQEVPSMVDVPADCSEYFYSSDFYKHDKRMCVLCKGIGDGDSNMESRLLYSGHNAWIHINCALWSAEVFEEIDGSLQNVHTAISRGRLIKCSCCNAKGATVGCNVDKCGEHYHYPCARNSDCIFLANKTVYCNQHKGNYVPHEVEKIFEINRPVYVELDRKKKKMIEPNKVQFFIGSLCVKKLGRFVAGLSDNADGIIPSEYFCTRLYWSAKEPWKIVEYNVKISIHFNNNYTIEGSNSGVNQITDSGINFTVDHSNNTNIVKLEMAQITKWHNSLLNGDEFEFYPKSDDLNQNEEEPQNNGDLLPPEIKDAIFEDLPHDLLDGISMLDILPKLMTYEDLVAMDMKNEAYFGSDLLMKDGKDDTLDDETENNDHCDNNNSDWNQSFESETINLLGTSRELKRSKSEVFSRVASAGSRSQQRSCSLTWNCKLDSPIVKRRKVNMFQELKIPENMLFLKERRLSLQNTNNNNTGESLLDRIKISQLDGIDDNIIMISNPVKCDRCHCTYRSHESYQRHLMTCEPFSSTSESESETTRTPDNIEITTSDMNHAQFQFNQNHQTIQFLNNNAVHNGGGQSFIPINNTNTNNFSSIGHQNPNMAQPNMSNMILTTTSQQNQIFTTQSIPVNQNSNLINSFHQNASQLFQPQLIQAQHHQPMIFNNQLIQPQQSQPQNNHQNIIQIGPNNGGKIILPQPTKRQKKNSSIQPKNNNLPLIRPNIQPQQNIMFQSAPQQQQQQQQPQPIIVQSLGGNNHSNLVQYVTADGYLATAQQQPQFLTSNTILPNTFQLQTDQGGNLILSNTSTGLSVLPLTQNQQPQVIGTLLQPQATTIQCGMMATEQMMLGSTPTLEMVTDPTSGCMYLTSQPVYYGLETIVRNTVMSSQQFVSTGMLSQNSSFSATTTQVFQASKIEPIMEVPTSYVVLNNANDTSNMMNVIPQNLMQQPQIIQQTQIPQNQSQISIIQQQQPQISIISTNDAQPQQNQPIQQQQPQQLSKPQSIILPKVNQKKTGNKSATVKPKLIAKPVRKSSYTAHHQNQQLQSTAPTQQQQQQQNIVPLYNNNNNSVSNLSNNCNLIVNSNIETNDNPINLPTSHYIGGSIPMNIVNPIPQYNQNSNTPTSMSNSRPTNRVLPMQTIHPKSITPPLLRSVTPPESMKLVDTILLAENNTKEFDMLKENTIVRETVMTSEVIDEKYTMLPSTPPLVSESPSPIPPALPVQIYHSPPVISIDTTCLATTKIEHELSSPPLISPEIKSQNVPLCEPSEITITSQTQEALNELNHLQLNEDDDDDDLTIKDKITEILDNLNETNNCDSISNNSNSVSNNDDVVVSTTTSTPVSEFAVNNRCDEDDRVTETIIKHETDLITNSCSSSSSNNVSNTIDDSSKIPPGPHILYEIQSQDGFTYKSTSITEIWNKVFEAVQIARKAHGLIPLPEGPLDEMSGHQMLGLKTNALKYLLEQLPGVEKCSNYIPKYHKKVDGGLSSNLKSGLDSCQSYSSGYMSDFGDDDVKENQYGAARCEPFVMRSSFDMFGWLASRHRKQPTLIIVQSDNEAIIPRRGSASNLPMAMRYRTLKETSRDFVGVYRSHIHGRGLFCTRDIEAGEMVIEYAGELIRSTLTDKREKYYDSKGIGCYMFKIDDNLVVDATMRGNAARFINHSCEPNCYSKVVDILGHKHIIIFALRRILQGEELTYDYKFPFEEEKIPCSCGSKRCRKYLN